LFAQQGEGGKPVRDFLIGTKWGAWFVLAGITAAVLFAITFVVRAAHDLWWVVRSSLLFVGERSRFSRSFFRSTQLYLLLIAPLHLLLQFGREAYPHPQNLSRQRGV
jgi:hypothetical protein